MNKIFMHSFAALAVSALLLVPFESRAEMKPKEAVELIEKTFAVLLKQAGNIPSIKKNILEPAGEFMNKSDLGRYIKLCKNVVGYIEKMQLAASFVNDLIQTGMATNEKQFATEFAKRFKAYLTLYTSPREFDNFLLGARFNEDDLQTVLYDLGRNFYKTLDKQTNKPQLKEAGRAIQNMTPAELARYVKVPKKVQEQLDAYQRDAYQQSKQK